MKLARHMALAATLAGCAHQAPKPSDTIDGTRRSLHVLSVYAEQLGREWGELVDAAIDRCRRQNLPTPHEREACLGILGRGDEFDEDLKRLTEIYDSTAEDLRELQKVLESIEDRFKQARQEQRR